MKQAYISLKTEQFNKQIFLVGYTKDGGFYFKDLLRIDKENKKCLVEKATADILNHGERIVTPHYTAVTSGEAKITHHYDGNAQISGTGVISGFYEDGNPKGAGIKSFPLYSNNNGGPVFSFLVWGCEYACRDAQDKDFLIIPNDQYIHTSNRDKNLNAYEIKGFYLLKEWFNPNDLQKDIVTYRSNIAGEVQLKLIPSPEKTPGVIGLLAAKSNHGFKDQFGFTLSAAPGKVYNNQYCESLSIIYPYQKIPSPLISLDYSESFK